MRLWEASPVSNFQPGFEFDKVLSAQFRAVGLPKTLGPQFRGLDFQKVLTRQFKPLTFDFEKVLDAQFRAVGLPKTLDPHFRGQDFQKVLTRQLKPLTSDFEMLLVTCSTLATDPGLNAAAVGLTLSQQRMLVGYFVYIIMWLICLYFVIYMLNANPEFTALFSVVVTMTGTSGHSLASLAKTMALRAFDFWQPPTGD